MRFLAWASDGNRASAKPVDAFSVMSAAKAGAREAYRSEAFEKYIDITVVAISIDGTETQHEFTVDVEFTPTFTARRRS